ncbi:MAG: hypothetical protein ACFFKA_10570 [Candidatus Thorarchaeota archaeon]|jgi:hypothetical protein
MKIYQELKEEYINKYNTLQGISWDAAEEFEYFKDELQKCSELEFNKFYNVPDLKLWIQDITEAIDIADAKYLLENGDFVAQERLLPSELVTIG